MKCGIKRKKKEKIQKNTQSNHHKTKEMKREWRNDLLDIL